MIDIAPMLIGLKRLEEMGFSDDVIRTALSKGNYQTAEVAIAACEIERLHSAIRKHRDQRGDDKCWMDDEELYKVLPEGYTPPVRDSAVELANCERFIQCRQNPATEYVSPQRRIEELEAEVGRLTDGIRSAVAHARTGAFCRTIDHYNECCDCKEITEPFLRLVQEPTP